jgi:hypothetical protein
VLLVDFQSAPTNEKVTLAPLDCSRLVGIRDGKRDAQNGHLSFLSALALQAGRRLKLLRRAFASIRDLVALAAILDVISHFLGDSSRRGDVVGPCGSRQVIRYTGLGAIELGAGGLSMQQPDQPG